MSVSPYLQGHLHALNVIATTHGVHHPALLAGDFIVHILKADCAASAAGGDRQEACSMKCEILKEVPCSCRELLVDNGTNFERVPRLNNDAAPSSHARMLFTKLKLSSPRLGQLSRPASRSVKVPGAVAPATAGNGIVTALLRNSFVYPNKQVTANCKHAAVGTIP